MENDQALVVSRKISKGDKYFPAEWVHRMADHVDMRREIDSKPTGGGRDS